MESHRLDFAEFYRRPKDECLFTVLVSVGDLDLAQELVAEAFARAWARGPGSGIPLAAYSFARRCLTSPFGPVIIIT